MAERDDLAGRRVIRDIKQNFPVFAEAGASPAEVLDAYHHYIRELDIPESTATRNAYCLALSGFIKELFEEEYPFEVPEIVELFENIKLGATRMLREHCQDFMQQNNTDLTLLETEALYAASMAQGAIEHDWGDKKLFYQSLIGYDALYICGYNQKLYERNGHGFQKAATPATARLLHLSEIANSLSNCLSELQKEAMEQDAISIKTKEISDMVTAYAEELTPGRHTTLGRYAWDIIKNIHIITETTPILDDRNVHYLPEPPNSGF